MAAVAGRAVAGGFDLALLCDLRVAGPTAGFGQPQVRRGIPAAFELVRSVVGEAVARDLCLTGRQIDAAEAFRLGIVQVVRKNRPGSEVALAVIGTMDVSVSLRSGHWPAGCLRVRWVRGGLAG